MQKKVEMLKFLSAADGGALKDLDQVKAIAVGWMGLMDKDRSGSVNKQEFKDSFRRIKVPDAFSEPEMEMLFREFDLDEGGTLTMQELAAALRDIFS